MLKTYNTGLAHGYHLLILSMVMMMVVVTVMMMTKCRLWCLPFKASHKVLPVSISCCCITYRSQNLIPLYYLSQFCRLTGISWGDLLLHVVSTAVTWGLDWVGLRKMAPHMVPLTLPVGWERSWDFDQRAHTCLLHVAWASHNMAAGFKEAKSQEQSSKKQEVKATGFLKG